MTPRFYSSLALSLLLSAGAHAASVTTSGLEARRLDVALVEAGADIHLEGNQDTQIERIRARELTCTKHNGGNYDSPKPDYYACSFMISTGDTLSVDGFKAQDLYEALLENKLIEDCGMGSCGIPTDRIDCSRTRTSWSRDVQWSCTIQADAQHVDQGH